MTTTTHLDPTVPSVVSLQPPPRYSQSFELPPPAYHHQRNAAVAYTVDAIFLCIAIVLAAALLTILLVLIYFLLQSFEEKQ